MIEKGDRIFYWKDNWLGTPLVEALNIPKEAHKYLNSKVVDLIDNFSWRISNIITTCVPELVVDILLVTIPK